MDNKRIVFTVIYDWLNDNNEIELFVFDTWEKAKAEYDRILQEEIRAEECGFDTITESVYDYEEDGDQLCREYFAYNEGDYWMHEHYHVVLEPREVK